MQFVGPTSSLWVTPELTYPPTPVQSHSPWLAAAPGFFPLCHEPWLRFTLPVLRMQRLEKYCDDEDDNIYISFKHFDAHNSPAMQTRRIR